MPGEKSNTEKTTQLILLIVGSACTVLAIILVIIYTRRELKNTLREAERASFICNGDICDVCGCRRSSVTEDSPHYLEQASPHFS